MKSAENFRANLRLVLESREISQRQLADRAGMSFPYVNRILVGKVEPSLENCDRIADALTLDLASMLASPRAFRRHFMEVPQHS